MMFISGGPGLVWSMVILCTVVPGSSPIHEHVSSIEINHHYNKRWEIEYTQAVFWDWQHKHANYHVRDFRILKDATTRPQRNWDTGKFEMSWKDLGRYRLITADDYYETWSQEDPELADRDFLPMEERLGLR